MHRARHIAACILLLIVGDLFGTASVAEAAFSELINYQGKLTTPLGVAVPDGQYNMRFWLLTTPGIATTSALWSETLTGSNRVSVENGLFSVMLGSTTPFTGVDFNQTLYLGVEIGGATTTPSWDGEMSPRKILGAVPAAFVANFAITASSASALGGVASSSFLRSDEADTMTATSSGTLVSFIQNGAGAIARFFSGVTEVFTILGNGNIGVGTSTPTARLAVSGNTLITGTTTLATTTATDLTLATALRATSGGTGLSTITQNQLLIGGAGNTWTQVATSSLGLGNGTFLGLSDTPSAYTANRLFFTNSGGTAVTDSADLVFTGTNLGIGSTSPSARLTVVGNAYIQGNSTTTGSITVGTGRIHASNNSLAGGSFFSGGEGIVASGFGSIAWGNNSASFGSIIASGDGSMALGSGAGIMATNSGSFAFGYGEPDFGGGIISGGIGSFAGGNGTTGGVLASGNGAFAFGGAVAATGNYATAFGRNFTNSAADTFQIGYTSTPIFTANATSIGIGTTSPSSRLTIQGVSGSTADLFRIASSTGSTTLAMLANGNLELPGQFINSGILWMPRTATQLNNWSSVAYGNGLFVAVSINGTNRVMTSPDGITWTARNAVGVNSWNDVAYGNGLFVAVSDGPTNYIMTSPDGITWTARTAPEANSWVSVSYGNGLFVAVSNNGTNRVMTSPDGITWIARSAAQANSWDEITFGNDLFVAVSTNGTNRAMTSPDGITWTARTTVGTTWRGITYGNGLFVAVANTGTNRVMTSPDGITWTARTAAEANSWDAVTYGNGIFVAISGGGTNRVMTSGVTETSALAHNNIYQGGTSLFGGLRAGTTTSSIASIFLQGEAGINPFAIASSSGTQLLTLTQAGNLGIGTTSPNSLLSVAGNTYIGGTLTTTGLASLGALGTTDATTTRLSVSGALYDTTNSAGSANMILQTTGTSTRWVTTSSLGLGNGTFLGLSDTPSAYTANRLFFTNSGGTAVTDSADLVFTGTNLGIGSTSPSARLTVGASIGETPFRIASSSGTDMLLLTSDGNLGIGTSSPLSRLTMRRDGVTGNVVSGIDQFFSFTNTSAGVVQFGNRLYIQTTNATATAIGGELIRIEDSTGLANTVRGIEVQADRGTSTQGENTALSGFARTFGVRGVTRGDAGGSFEPAGIYGETQGTTQGNAIRAYSSTITTTSLVKLFQDTSTFTGTGLLMNFGNSGGSFSSTTASRFIDLQNAGTSRFIVGAYGMLTIGDGTTSQNAGIQIGNGGLCVDNDGACTASTTGRITSVSTASGNSDLAEMYFSNDDLLPGEIVYLEGGLSVGRASLTTADQVIGVVSTEPGLLLGYNDSSLNEGEVGHPIALAGRVPIRISNENGQVRTGDSLMLSSIPGVAMKATSTGTIIGVALEDYDEDRAYSDTFINQFGENIIVPNYVPINREDDPRINDGCYFGGGTAAGDTPCIPLVSTSTEDRVTEADALEAERAKQDALRELHRTKSDVMVTATGDEVQVGQIIMFVNLEQRLVGDEGAMMLASLLSAPANEGVEVETIWQRLVLLAERFVDGALSVFTLKADRVETTELCVDDVCVNAENLRALLGALAENPIDIEEGGDGSGIIITVIPGEDGEAESPAVDIPTPEPSLPVLEEPLPQEEADIDPFGITFLDEAPQEEDGTEPIVEKAEVETSLESVI